MSRQTGYGIARWKEGRFWSLTDERGRLICVCVYKKGASEVKRLLEEREEYAAPDARNASEVETIGETAD